MRYFKSVLSLAVLSSLTSMPALLSGKSVNGSKVSKGKMYTFESDESGFNTKSYFYDNGEQVVVFDTQFTEELAKKFAKYIKSHTSNPISHVVLTHPNPDKFNGISVFKTLGAEVVSSTKTAEAMPGVHSYKKYFFVKIAKMFTEETYPKLGTVDVTFQNTLELKLKSGEKILLSELPKPGVSSNQTVAYIPKVNALVVGDLVHHKAHAWLEGGIINGTPKPTISGWIDDLSELARQFKQTNPDVFGGRGKIAPLSKVAPEQISYLKKADKLVSTYLTTVKDKSELTGNNAQRHYNALQQLFEKAFAAYDLSYMIGYGVYGLVSQKLAETK